MKAIMPTQNYIYTRGSHLAICERWMCILIQSNCFLIPFKLGFDMRIRGLGLGFSKRRKEALYLRGKNSTVSSSKYTNI
jgi:hypothetical protein